jgi:hypothetical protein
VRLSVFLLACIADDEAEAVSIGMGREHAHVDLSLVRAANRTLAECEARRQVVKLHAPTIAPLYADRPGFQREWLQEVG